MFIFVWKTSMAEKIHRILEELLTFRFCGIEFSIQTEAYSILDSSQPIRLQIFFILAIRIAIS